MDYFIYEIYMLLYVFICFSYVICKFCFILPYNKGYLLLVGHRQQTENFSEQQISNTFIALFVKFKLNSVPLQLMKYIDSNLKKCNTE